MAINLNNNLNISIFAALKVSEVSGVPVLLLSNPGIGKTTTVYMFAQQRGYQVVELRGNSTTAEEVNGYDVSPQDVTFDRPMAACHLRPSWFQEVLHNQERGLKTLLFLDEITTANEFVQAALLKLIFDRTCGREPLPEDTLIVSAGNYSGNLANSMSLLPPVMNRFMIYNIIPSPSDLEIFLNKYNGSAIGKREDYGTELTNVLAEIDKQHRTYPDDVYNKIGELFESSVKLACQQVLDNSVGVDLTITDQHDIYNKLSTDPRVYGFISFRTLNYLRDVAIAWYACFGKDGINSANFRMAIDGLCGIGLKYTKGKNRTDSEAESIHVGEYFHNALKAAANDCEKLNNDTFIEYADYFKDWSSKAKIETPDLVAANSKLEDLTKVKELQFIERPVEAEVIDKMLTLANKSISASVDGIVKACLTFDGVNKDAVQPEILGGTIQQFNAVVDLYTLIGNLTKDDSRGYPDTVRDRYRSQCMAFKKTSASLRTFSAQVKKTLPMVFEALPEIKALVQES